MNLRKAAEMALEIIEGEWPADDEIASPVMYALREALAKPEQDPVAYRTVNNVGAYVYHSADRLPNEYGLRGEALYLHPAPIPEGWKLVPKEPTHEEALAKPEQEPVAWRIKVHKYDEETDESSFPWEYHHIRGEGQPLYLHPAPAITEGWQLVPKEPTKEMSDTFWSAYIPAPDGIAQSCSFEDFHDFRYMYKAMLDAAPKPGELK